MHTSHRQPHSHRDAPAYAGRHLAQRVARPRHEHRAQAAQPLRRAHAHKHSCRTTKVNSRGGRMRYFLCFIHLSLIYYNITLIIVTKNLILLYQHTYVFILRITIISMSEYSSANSYMSSTFFNSYNIIISHTH